MQVKGNNASIMVFYNGSLRLNVSKRPLSLGKCYLFFPQKYVREIIFLCPERHNCHLN